MTSLTDYAKNMLGRSVVGRRPALPTAVFIALGTGANHYICLFFSAPFLYKSFNLPLSYFVTIGYNS